MTLNCIWSYCGLEKPEKNDSEIYCLQQYIFTEIQAVTGNWQDLLDLFIESVNIYSVGEGSCSDVMEYITIKDSETPVLELCEVIAVMEYSTEYSIDGLTLKSTMTQIDDTS